MKTDALKATGGRPGKSSTVLGAVRHFLAREGEPESRLNPRWYRHGAVAFAFAVTAVIYAYQFYVQGGQSHLNPDALHYLASSRGEVVERPFNTRLVGPLTARAISALTGVSAREAFEILTVVSLFGSMVLLSVIVSKYAASVAYQFAVLMSLGAGLAVLFGHAPILVDGLLLLFTCLTILAIRTPWLALVFIGLAAITKEYGILLILPWVAHTWRIRGFAYLLSAFLPIALLVSVMFLVPGLSYDQRGSQAGQGFLVSQLKYQTSVFNQGGLFIYLKTIYIWAWVALWPLMLVAGIALLLALARSKITDEHLLYASMIATAPVLMLGDWDRASVVLTPFACLVGTRVPFARDLRFNLMLATGGLATALARPAYTEKAVPRSVTFLFIAISVMASAAILILLIRWFFNERLIERSSVSAG
jgi:hypothetical protein